MENNCGENCTCNKEEKKCSCKETISNLKKEKEDLNDKYLRVYAELDTYKRRVQKEKDELKENTKISMLSAILEIDSDLSIARKSIKDEGVDLIFNKLKSFLKSHQVEEIQTEVYDPDLHEVVSVIKTGEKKIIDVISKGYTLNGKPFKYPKIVLSE